MQNKNKKIEMQTKKNHGNVKDIKNKRIKHKENTIKKKG